MAECGGEPGFQAAVRVRRQSLGEQLSRVQGRVKDGAKRRRFAVAEGDP
jgi:hypothetical protein